MDLALRAAGAAGHRIDGLWWAQSAGDAPVSSETIGQLAQSGIVEWAAPAYCRTDESENEGARFAVNPTRLPCARTRSRLSPPPACFCPRSPSTCSAGLVSRVLVALRIDGPGAAARRTAVHAAQRITATLLTEQQVGTAPGLHFENIPYYPRPATRTVPARRRRASSSQTSRSSRCNGACSASARRGPG